MFVQRVPSLLPSQSGTVHGGEGEVVHCRLPDSPLEPLMYSVLRSRKLHSEVGIGSPVASNCPTASLLVDGPADPDFAPVTACFIRQFWNAAAWD